MSFHRHYGTGSYAGSSGSYVSPNKGLGYSSSFSSPRSSYSTSGTISYSGSPASHRSSISGYSSIGYSPYTSGINYYNPYSVATSYRRSSISRSSSLPRDNRRDHSLNSRYYAGTSRTASPSRSSVFSHSITCRAIIPDMPPRMSRYDYKFARDEAKSNARSKIEDTSANVSTNSTRSVSNATKSAPRSSIKSTQSHESGLKAALKSNHPHQNNRSAPSGRPKANDGTSDYESSQSSDECEEVVVTSSLSSKGIASQESRRIKQLEKLTNKPNTTSSTSNRHETQNKSNEVKTTDKSTSSKRDKPSNRSTSNHSRNKSSNSSEEKSLKLKKKRNKSIDIVSRSSSSGYISTSDCPSDREGLSSSKSPVHASKKSEIQNGDLDYKKLYEEQLVENEKLLDRLRICDKDLKSSKGALESQNKIANASAESERREKRGLERKLSEMEEELKLIHKLKSENEKLRAENRALTRVVSKLTNSAAVGGAFGGPLSALNKTKN